MMVGAQITGAAVTTNHSKIAKISTPILMSR
ncbi:hypothetical protein Aazo_4334 ['Nostoc azollae' 0708]|uniref:Uncharacterized protein n=1 Tax=Nostoc azollae (strain 0708) TaxID=551115 RepID=D7DWL9_NOSA0|nr:hypothetical protein Aazo_4334 ['Nostoc azollae' 0708]